MAGKVVDTTAIQEWYKRTAGELPQSLLTQHTMTYVEVAYTRGVCQSFLRSLPFPLNRFTLEILNEEAMKLGWVIQRDPLRLIPIKRSDNG